MMRKLFFALCVLSYTIYNAQTGTARVGIGTTTPAATLDIVSKDNTSSTKALEINNSSNVELVTVTNNGQVGINNPTPEADALLELKSTNKALLITRVPNVSAITNPVNGMVLYDISKECFRSYENNVWTDCWSASGGKIATINCAGTTNNGTLTRGIAASGVSSLIPYTGGDGGSHNGQTVTSTGVTGLTAILDAGTFATGNGTLTYNITGTPSIEGTANFAINIGGKTCTLSITVNLPAPQVSTLNCSTATNAGSLTDGVSASGVSSSIPYTGGNGINYNSTTFSSYGVNGLTATLSSGTLANGSGTISLSITGTPSGDGTANFDITLGGQTCTLSRTVAVGTPVPIPAPVNITTSSGVWSASRSGDVNNDGIDDILLPIWASGNSAIRVGNTSASTPLNTNFGTVGNAWHVSYLGDYNGDGYNDVLSSTGQTSGSTFYTGGSSLTFKFDGGIGGPGATGDINNDGLSDFIALGSGATTTAGKIYYGNTSAISSASSNINAGMSSTAYWGGQTYADALGDFNGDGLNDMVTLAGIFTGKNGSNADANANITFTNYVGTNNITSVSAAGDVNGDGYADALITDSNKVYVLFGGSSPGTSINLSTLASTGKGFEINMGTLTYTPGVYADVEALGDVNGDGLADIAFATYGSSGYSSYNDQFIIYGKTTATPVVASSLTNSQGKVVSKTLSEGQVLVGMSDINGDGAPDFITSSYNTSGKLFVGGSTFGFLPNLSLSTSGTIIGTSASELIRGSSGNDTITSGGGYDIIYSGSGNDDITINGNYVNSLYSGYNATYKKLARIDGGQGNNTIILADLSTATTPNELDLTAISNVGIGFGDTGVGLSRISNINKFNIGTNKLTLNLVDVMDMSQGMNAFNNANGWTGLGATVSRHQLIIQGTGTLSVKNSSQWTTTSAGSVTNGGKTYNIYNTVGANQGQLLVESTVTINFN